MHSHRRAAMKKHFFDLRNRLATAAIGIALLSILYKNFPPIVFSCFIAFYMIAAFFSEWLPMTKKSQRPLRFLSPIYPIFPAILFILLNQDPTYRSLIPILFISVFVADTGAYFFGKSFGKNFIATSISPKKTWEGFFGGFILSYISLILYCLFMSKSPSYIYILPTTFIICLLGLAGDLFESYIKRMAKIKDSGSILPGHGGLLDRVDALLFVVVFFYFARSSLINIF